MSNVRLLAGRPMSRRAFVQRAAAAGVGLSALGALMASCAGDDGPDRPLTPAFYDWILSLFPTQAVSDSWDQEVNVQTAPVEGFGIERFVRGRRRRREHLGHIRRHDPVRRDGCPDRCGRHRALG